jgi:ribosomal protein S12 methylthiotransferase accessory factor YcaO
MEDPAARPSARVTAARAVLEMAQKGIELEEVIDRVAALERAFEEKGRKQ